MWRAAFDSEDGPSACFPSCPHNWHSFTRKSVIHVLHFLEFNYLESDWTLTPAACLIYFLKAYIPRTFRKIWIKHKNFLSYTWYKAMLVTELTKRKLNFMWKCGNVLNLISLMTKLLRKTLWKWSYIKTALKYLNKIVLKNENFMKLQYLTLKLY